jgi:hypothetical protein
MVLWQRQVYRVCHRDGRHMCSATEHPIPEEAS